MNSLKLGVVKPPFIRLVPSAKTGFWFVAACLFAPLLQAILSGGLELFWVPFASVLGAVLAESAFDWASGKLSVDDGSAVVCGLALALLLPPRFPPLYAFLGGAFAVAVPKRCFGGLGSNWANPAVFGWLLLALSWPGAFAAATAGSADSALSAAVAKGLGDASGSPVALLKILGFKAAAWDDAATKYLNGTLFSWIGAELPAGYLGYLSGGTAASLLVDRGVAGLMLASLALLAFGAARFRLALAFFASYGLLVRLWGGIPYGGGFGTGDVVFALSDGGVLLAAFVLLADPATTGKTLWGKAAAAIIAGALAFLFRVYLGLSAGAVLAVAAVNVLTPSLRMLEDRFIVKRRLHA